MNDTIMNHFLFFQGQKGGMCCVYKERFSSHGQRREYIHGDNTPEERNGPQN